MTLRYTQGHIELNQNMKILFFSPYYYPYISGVTIYPKKILEHLAIKNEITVLTFHHDKKLQTVQSINRLYIFRIPYLVKLSKGFISPQSLLYFFKYVKDADLIILNQPNFEGWLLAIFAKIFGKKIISIFHCQVFLKKNVVNNIIGSFLNCSMKLQLHLSNTVIAYTKDYIDSLPYFKKYIQKTKFIFPPIEYFQPDKKFFDKLIVKKGKNIWIGFAGRISNEKGIEYLVQSINRLYSHTKCVLIFAGPYGSEVAGEGNYYNKILQLLKKSKVKYMFLGNLMKEELFAFYSSIDILVLPSINQTEAFGMVQAEAMITGTPVIASNLPGVRMPIRLTKMGVITEPKNSKQISKAIDQILKNKNKFSNAELIKRANNIFSIKKTYDFYNKLFTTL